MEYTQNYQLPLWDKADAVKRTDFNENNQKIDDALEMLSAEHIYIGNYVGDGTNDRIIKLPFTPKFALVLGQLHSNKRVILLLQGRDFYIESSTWYSSPDYNIQLLNDTFKIQNQSFNNQKDIIFNYILFR